jgi:hypothetical protein
MGTGMAAWCRITDSSRLPLSFPLSIIVFALDLSVDRPERDTEDYQVYDPHRNHDDTPGEVTTPFM